ncbi:MAG: hypothetical protein ABIP63_08775 [Thermoanaerobaculia bacterium]
MRLMIPAAISLFAIAASSQTLPNPNSGSSDLRKAWDWTVEERLANRLDPAKIRDRKADWIESTSRNRVSAAASTRSDVSQNDSKVVTYEIDGRRNPELFLEYELFDILLAGLAPETLTRAKQRAFYGPSIRQFGYDENAFWNSLESVVSGYLAGGSAETDGEARCVERYQALQAARRLFGHRFDQFLYLVVAPTVRSSTSTMDQNHGAALRRAEAGCQR